MIRPWKAASRCRRRRTPRRLVTDADTPVVAEQFAFYPSDRVGEGVATLMGRPGCGAARRCSHAGVAQGRTAVLAVANPGAVAATVSVRDRARRRAPSGPPDMQDVAGRSRWGTRRSPSRSGSARTRAPSSSDATEPVVVNRALYSVGDISRSEAIVGGP